MVTTTSTLLLLRAAPRVALLRRSSASSASSFSSDAHSASTSPANWLEANCGDVPTQPRPHDAATGEMLRGGHALQVANRALLGAELRSSSRGGAATHDPAHVETLQTLRAVEEKGVERIESAVAERGVRFRPSLLLPVLHCSSAAIGGALSLLGENVSAAYQTGVKTAISDYYNDQVREIYATRPDEVALKELFKTARDEELAFVDAHSPEASATSAEATTAAAAGATGAAAEAAEHPVATFAKASSKLLLQVAKAL